MQKIKSFLLPLSLVCLFGVTTAVSAHETADDKQLIRHTINSIYDTPEHKVVIDPVVVQGDHAIASWVQQDKGGRALLHRNSKGTWAIVLCAGKSVKEAKFLTETGIPNSDAEALAKGINAAEENISKEKIALFDSFKGVMRNTHKPAHDHGHDHGKDHSHHESSTDHAHN